MNYGVLIMLIKSIFLEIRNLCCPPPWVITYSRQTTLVFIESSNCLPDVPVNLPTSAATNS